MDPQKDTIYAHEAPADASSFEKEGHGLVPARFRGTDADKHDMSALGKTQVLRVRSSLKKRCIKPRLTFEAQLPLYHDARICQYCHCLMGISASVRTSSCLGKPSANLRGDSWVLPSMMEELAICFGDR